ncbi:unnamed protein product [Adineta steineri]|uniref:Tetratricopeptide repeat protein n=1 Tax=Adineta steineri TaxID=433720 RepID=A0A819RD14_9BILA|nr:unnamed protein product [Adineta steineri]CAF0939822.1 unnamed protein product [Adineta steineri]CAF4034952.1 unnamed protein product [Adineta steineri]CAF4042535.1 unnamed protein product [Adineta steineri]
MHEKDGIISGLGRQNMTTDDNWTNPWWSRLLEILCQLPYLDNSHVRLVNESKTYYSEKEAELRILDEFKSDYTPEKAVYWQKLHECCRMLIHDLNTTSMMQTNIIFKELCNLFPLENDWLEAHRYHCLGICCKEHPSHYPEPESVYYEKAINIWKNYQNDNELNVDIDIGDIQLALAHCQMKHSNSDVKLLDPTIASYILSLAKPMTEIERAVIYGKISKTYLLKRSYSDKENEAYDAHLVSDDTKEMLKYRNLELQETLRFCNPADKKVIELYTGIVYMQKLAGYYDEALVSYEKIIQYYMGLKNETDRHIRLWEEYRAVVEIYRDFKQDYSAALNYQLLVIENMAKLYSMTVDKKNADYWTLKNIQSNKSSIAQAYFDLADIYIEMDEFKLARENLLISKKLYEENADCIWCVDDTELIAIEEKLLTLESLCED